ncbi:MAG: hypothetical protein OES10_13240 [Gammaproteobacteria bacterium]|nr:hypothetical protein [Gammaproteobacteria bacterium]
MLTRRSETLTGHSLAELISYRQLAEVQAAESIEVVLHVVLAEPHELDRPSVCFNIQACAENRLSDAQRIYKFVQSEFPDGRSNLWVAHSIMSQKEQAIETLLDLDESEDIGSLSVFLVYAYFDARPFPNLMALLKSQGVVPRQPRDIPCRCKL